MSAAERRAFLLHGTRTAKLATVRRDGRPHVAPVCFVLDGDDIVFMTWHSSVKGLALRRDPRVALVVDDEDPPFSFVLVEGVVTLSEDIRSLQAWARRIATRYQAPEDVDRYTERNAVEGELVVRVRPQRWIARAAMAE
jgi:PPOX class probable F420-dependent enzyme